MTLKVIGTGFPRTGTLSLKLALNELGFGPCFHASEFVMHPERMPLWLRAGEGDADWDAIFDGYQSTTDAPGCYFWRELVAHYPEAKVLHSVRDPERWFESTQATVFGPNSFSANPPPGTKPFFDMLTKRRGGRNLQDRSQMLDWFERHTEDVKEAIPDERLLVFEASQGWEPLCAFLGVAVPETAYPRVNDREQLAERMAAARNPDGTINEDKLREGVTDLAKRAT